MEFSDINIYPLSSKIKTAKFATDSILDPSVILVNGADFIISDGCIAVRKVVDPFTGSNGRWAGSPGEPNAVIWFCDAEFDTGFVQDYIGYPVGITAEESTAYLKHVINTFWDVLSSGPSYRLVQALIGAVCGVPTVFGRTETVDTVTRLSDGSITVATDARVYKLGPGSNLRNLLCRGCSGIWRVSRHRHKGVPERNSRHVAAACRRFRVRFRAYKRRADCYSSRVVLQGETFARRVAVLPEVPLCSTATMQTEILNCL